MYIPYPPSQGAAAPIAIGAPMWLDAAVVFINNALRGSFPAPSSPSLQPLPSQELARRQDPGPLSTNAMVGIVVGILLVAFIAVVFWFLWYVRPFGPPNKHHHRRRHHHRKSDGAAAATNPPKNPVAG